MSMIINPFVFSAGGGVGLPVTDNYNRADNASTLNTSSSGHSWIAWRGTWGTESNQGYMSANGNGENYAVINSGEENVAVRCEFPVIQNGSGISFRGTDETNVFIWERVNSSVINCYKRVSGSYTELFSLSETLVDGDSLMAICNGNSIELYRNDVLKTTITESFNNTAGHHGVYKSGSSTTGRWEDFSIT